MILKEINKIYNLKKIYLIYEKLEKSLKKSEI